MRYVHFHNYKVLVLLIPIIGLLYGCSSHLNTDNKSGFLARFKNRNLPVYHEFCDILVPGKLKVNKKKSCVFHTSEFSVGVLSLKGRMEATDLINFFEKNMSDDNWNSVNSFKSRRSIMLFKKGNRWCVICIKETKRISYAEVWVLPNESELITEVFNSS